jgi:alkylation response protein AidB-like acyl-CoA dehydrogenase
MLSVWQPLWDKGEIINFGCKTFITNGNVADLVLVFARNLEKKDKISCIIVEKGTHGFTCSQKIEKMGLRTSPFSQLFFEDCKVPKDIW